ncbi:hypothetical protein BRC81_09025 [Halobacteriales archaeon QS_1_68_20]|nr:MAG: hypothetical protein BRC81_09025 [Halobacteriales archaeon QS_1_68_20]
MSGNRQSRRAVVKSVSVALGLLALSSTASAYGYDYNEERSGEVGDAFEGEAAVDGEESLDGEPDEVRTTEGDYNDERHDLD